jgi:hypothetical protein
LICIFSVSRQLFLFSTLQKFLLSFCSKKRVYPAVLLKNFISINGNRFYPFFSNISYVNGSAKRKNYPLVQFCQPDLRMNKPYSPP